MTPDVSKSCTDPPRACSTSVLPRALPKVSMRVAGGSEADYAQGGGITASPATSRSKTHAAYDRAPTAPALSSTGHRRAFVPREYLLPSPSLVGNSTGRRHLCRWRAHCAMRLIQTAAENSRSRAATAAAECIVPASPTGMPAYWITGARGDFAGFWRRPHRAGHARKSVLRDTSPMPCARCRRHHRNCVDGGYGDDWRCSTWPVCGYLPSSNHRPGC